MHKPLDGHFTKLDHGFSNARKCLRCGWEWIRKPKDAHAGLQVDQQEPKRCPRCRSEKWRESSREVSHVAR